MRSLIIYMSILTTLFGYELSVSKEFSRTLEPSRMSASFELYMSHKDQKAIQRAFKEAVNGMKEYEICSGGSYTIEPRYDYKNSQRIFLGYTGQTAFTCRFESIEEIQEVYELLSSYKNIELRQNPIAWTAGNAEIRSAREALEFEAVGYAKEYIGIMQSRNIATCKTKKIDISGGSYIQPGALRAMAARSGAFEPTREPIKVDISTHYIFECE